MTTILYANDKPTYAITPTSKLVCLPNGLYDLVNVEPTKLKKNPLILIQLYHRSDADIWVRIVRMLPAGDWTSRHYYLTDKQAVRLSRVVGRAGGQVTPRYDGWNWRPMWQSLSSTKCWECGEIILGTICRDEIDRPYCGPCWRSLIE